MESQFGKFTASELFCAHCNRSQPVEERLVQATPEGEVYEFLCVVCGASVGRRTVSVPAKAEISPEVNPDPVVSDQRPVD